MFLRGSSYRLVCLGVWNRGQDLFCVGWTVLGVARGVFLMKRHGKSLVREG